MFKRKTIFSTALLGLVLSASPTVSAVAHKPDIYTPVSDVSAHQAQVVFYRAANMGAQPGAAHVYVDREFHNGLMPGGYTAFCVSPGQHTVGAYLNDAPRYEGKNNTLFSANMEGGSTYFLRATEGGDGAPQAVTRAVAESELAGSRRQVHVLSRASSVLACDYQGSTPVAAPLKEYTLSGDVLFKFGKSGYNDISSSGRQAILDLISQLRNENVNLSHIEVVGHTDPIGSASSNQALGLKRAQTVRRLLIDGGLPSTSVGASSAGANEPLSSGCEGSRAEQIACYAQDRRVVVRVDTRNN